MDAKVKTQVPGAGLDCAAIKQLIESEPLFILHMPDGSKIQLFASGPEGITGTGIRFENRIWQLLLLLPGEVIP